MYNSKEGSHESVEQVGKPAQVGLQNKKNEMQSKKLEIQNTTFEVQNTVHSRFDLQIPIG